MKKGIIFDLDGTLWDSSEEVVDSWLIALEDYPEMQSVITRDSIQAIMGKTTGEIEDILFASLPKKERKQVLAHCLQVENEYIEKHGGKLFEGLEETLEVLKKDYHLYIVSNCQVGYIEAFLKHHGLGEYFEDFESHGGTGKSKGENICLVVERNKLEKAVYVGDTQGDYEATMFAGLPFVHVKKGFGKVNGEVACIEKLSELVEVVDRIMEGKLLIQSEK